VATGRQEALRIFGADYPTKDGTCVRDYIHVMDLAYGHVAALDAMQRMPGGTAMTVNLGTGDGVSVLEMVETFERVSGVPIPRKIVERREGDAAVCYADPSRAKELLGWEAKLGVEEMCRDAWNWQKNNPMGYSPSGP
jgi:UDP-glucose 4-epimerase